MYYTYGDNALVGFNLIAFFPLSSIFSISDSFAFLLFICLSFLREILPRRFAIIVLSCNYFFGGTYLYQYRVFKGILSQRIINLCLSTSLFSFCFPISFPFASPRYLCLPASFLTLYLSWGSILERFKCCGSVTHGDGSYTKRISPVDRTGSGSPTLPLLRSRKLVSSLKPAPFASPFAFIRPFPSAARDRGIRKDTLNTLPKARVVPQTVLLLNRHFTA